ncbi:MAG TPA: ATP-binding domain-containing protein [Trebonia sp.]|jgi:DNA helicase IV|nr:ATP-binding domain-containing protein [Trebonia sp.]
MPGDDDEDPVIGAERAYLATSRDYLRIMREDVLAINPMAGDPVSLEFLKADLWRRAESLKDLPDAPLFFGRLNYSDDSDFKGNTFHIGRRHVHDRDGTPVVLDWRAPVSTPFYRASTAEPMGLDLRRRFGFSGGDLTAYEDESFAGGAGTGGKKVSRLLVDEIERPRSGPMRDIVATIQPEQDDIVRADADRTVCVQGAPGTGKTAVGLHRVAYLLYAHKERVTRRGVVVVGPNLAFLSYIRNVLPALGELDVSQATVTDLVASVPVKGTDSDRTAVLKSDARMAEVLRNALWSSLRKPEQPLMLARGSRRWRVPAYEIAELAGELKARGVRYGAGRELLGHRIAHVVLTQMEAAGETCDDRTHDSVRRSAPVRAVVSQVWPKVEAKRLVFGLLSSASALAAAANGIFTGAEQQAILWDPAPRGPGSAKWSRADLVLIDEASDLIERMPSLAHVVVDEAQDLSPMELRAIGRRCSTGAATVLGDIAQGTTPWATSSWDSLLEYLGKADVSMRELEVGYRVPRQILDYASRLLPAIAPGLRPAESLRSDESSLTVSPVPAGALYPRVADECGRALGTAGSVAVICADDCVGDVAAALRAAQLDFRVLGSEGQAATEPTGAAGPEGDAERLVVVPVTLVKGLEFDHVVLAEPARIAAASGETYGLRRLYVALTRAVSRLTVLHEDTLPSELCYVP